MNVRSHIFFGLAFLILFFQFSVKGYAQCGSKDSAYQILFGTQDQDVGYDVVGTSDSGLLVAGIAPFLAGSGQSAGTIIKLNRFGEPLWVKQCTSPSRPTFLYRVIETKDKSIIALGYVSTGAEANTLVLKLSPDGASIWSRELIVPGAGEQFGLMLTETDDGNLVITSNVNNQNTTIVQAQLFKINSNTGDIIWDRQFRFNGTVEARSLLADGSSVVVVGVLNGLNQTLNDGFIMKLKHSTGEVLWMKAIESEGLMNRLLDIRKSDNKYLLVIQNGLLGDNNVKPALLTMDTDGNFANTLDFNFGTKNRDNYPGRWVTVCRNGDIVQAYGENVGAGLSRPVLARFNPAGNLIWAYEYRAVNNLYINRVAEDANGFIAMVGTASEDATQPRQFLTIKASADGTIPGQNPGACSPQSISVSNAFSPYTFYDFTWESNASEGAQSSDAIVSFEDLQLPPPSTCASQNICSNFSLSGPTKVCTDGDEIMIATNRSAGCNNSVTWSYNTNLAELVSTTDSLLVLKPKTLDDFDLRIDAQLNGCTVLNASWTVTVKKRRPIQFSLGIDSTICSDKYTLQGPMGMARYAWSNGSTSPTIQVNTSGNYWLLVTDDCGQTWSDTISLFFAPANTFSLGNDVIICGNGSLNLQGPSNMQSYKWSDGSNNRDITITNAGLYWLEATDGCGKTFRDSISATAAAAAESFSLGKDVRTCRDTVLQLTAPTAMSSYTWSTGSNSASISVKQPGKYWVVIRDACQGQASDTIEIEKLPIPSVQIGSDTIICGSQPWLLDARNPGSQFLWSTGDTSQRISVTSSGRYSVVVTNRDGCSSSARIRVDFASGSNFQGYQMPSVFTPNSDGLNDCFGLKKWGNVTIQRFEVYNRWGERVFQGKSLQDCWDGKVDGQLQKGSTFAYVVVVKTACGIVERKGLVTIIL